MHPDRPRVCMYVRTYVKTIQGDIHNKQYMSSKIGHDKIDDSVVTASFQNIVPGDYTRDTSSISNTFDSDTDPQAYLPGFTCYKSVMKMMEEMVDVSGYKMIPGRPRISLMGGS